MNHEIKGTTLPVLLVNLEAGEKVIAESGELSWLTDSIQLTTSTKMAGSKGLVGGLKRAFAGGSLFMTEYRAEGGPGTVAFATKVPGEILVVPQFTLYGDVSGGRRPSWIRAAPPEVASERVEAFARALALLGARVSKGAFREHMDVELVNDGPVTLVLDGAGL